MRTLSDGVKVAYGFELTALLKVFSLVNMNKPPFFK